MIDSFNVGSFVVHGSYGTVTQKDKDGNPIKVNLLLEAIQQNMVKYEERLEKRAKEQVNGEHPDYTTQTSFKVGKKRMALVTAFKDGKYDIYISPTAGKLDPRVDVSLSEFYGILSSLAQLEMLSKYNQKTFELGRDSFIELKSSKEEYYKLGYDPKLNPVRGHHLPIQTNPSKDPLFEQGNLSL